MIEQASQSDNSYRSVIEQRMPEGMRRIGIELFDGRLWLPPEIPYLREDPVLAMKVAAYAMLGYTSSEMTDQLPQHPERSTIVRIFDQTIFPLFGTSRRNTLCHSGLSGPKPLLAVERGISSQALAGLNITKRRAQVMARAALGESNTQIGAHLAISPQTVTQHVAAILQSFPKDGNGVERPIIGTLHCLSHPPKSQPREDQASTSLKTRLRGPYRAVKVARSMYDEAVVGTFFGAQFWSLAFGLSFQERGIAAYAMLGYSDSFIADKMGPEFTVSSVATALRSSIFPLFGTYDRAALLYRGVKRRTPLIAVEKTMADDIVAALDFNSDESAVLGLIGRGESNEEIGHQLRMSPPVVERHIACIRQRLPQDGAWAGRAALSALGILSGHVDLTRPSAIGPDWLDEVLP